MKILELAHTTYAIKYTLVFLVEYKERNLINENYPIGKRKKEKKMLKTSN